MGIKLEEYSNEAGTDKGYVVNCVGCKQKHVIRTHKPDGDPNPCWDFNGDVKNPTFSPSVKIWWHEGEDEIFHQCHFFIRDGFMQYCSDTTHELSGQTVKIPDSILESKR